MSWKYYNIFYISSKSSNLYPNNASHLHLFFLNDQKKDAIVVFNVIKLRKTEIKDKF